mmetsp:Transcript_107365/g.334660  ORF Transcript_107365/g.334660 Transcript_107365/m.334660 type:complete len:247 (+) Transcript_107365:271-1011(+)
MSRPVAVEQVQALHGHAVRAVLVPRRHQLQPEGLVHCFDLHLPEALARDHVLELLHAAPREPARQGRDAREEVVPHAFEQGLADVLGVRARGDQAAVDGAHLNRGEADGAADPQNLRLHHQLLALRHRPQDGGADLQGDPSGIAGGHDWKGAEGVDEIVQAGLVQGAFGGQQGSLDDDGATGFTVGSHALDDQVLDELVEVRRDLQVLDPPLPGQGRALLRAALRQRGRRQPAQHGGAAGDHGGGR